MKKRGSLVTDFALSRQNKLLIQQPQLKIAKNKITLITGDSGNGKSSFLKAITNLVTYSGNVDVLGKNLARYSQRELGRTIGLAFQNANDQFLNITVQEELDLSLKNGRHPYFTDHRLKQVLADLQLNPLLDHVVYSLSGGQKKKLQLLLMLMMGQPILLLDEPFSGLDQQSINHVIEIIQHCQAVQPQTIIIISHQLMGLRPLVDYHLTLTNQQLVYAGGVN